MLNQITHAAKQAKTIKGYSSLNHLLSDLHDPLISPSHKFIRLQLFIYHHPKHIIDVKTLAALLNICNIHFNFPQPWIVILLKQAHKHLSKQTRPFNDLDLEWLLAGLPITLWQQALTLFAGDKPLKDFLRQILKNSPSPLKAGLDIMNQLTQEKQSAFIALLKEYDIQIEDKDAFTILWKATSEEEFNKCLKLLVQNPNDLPLIDSILDKYIDPSFVNHLLLLNIKEFATLINATSLPILPFLEDVNFKAWNVPQYQNSPFYNSTNMGQFLNLFDDKKAKEIILPALIKLWPSPIPRTLENFILLLKEVSDEFAEKILFPFLHECKFELKVSLDTFQRCQDYPTISKLIDRFQVIPLYNESEAKEFIAKFPENLALRYVITKPLIQQEMKKMQAQIKANDPQDKTIHNFQEFFFKEMNNTIFSNKKAENKKEEVNQFFLSSSSPLKTAAKKVNQKFSQQPDLKNDFINLLCNTASYLIPAILPAIIIANLCTYIQEGKYNFQLFKIRNTPQKQFDNFMIHSLKKLTN